MKELRVLTQAIVIGNGGMNDLGFAGRNVVKGYWHPWSVWNSLDDKSGWLAHCFVWLSMALSWKVELGLSSIDAFKCEVYLRGVHVGIPNHDRSWAGRFWNVEVGGPSDCDGPAKEMEGGSENDCLVLGDGIGCEMAGKFKERGFRPDFLQI